jgi:hypothetical protein
VPLSQNDATFWRLRQTGSCLPDLKIARFIERMLLRRAEDLPQGGLGYTNWSYTASGPKRSRVAAESASDRGTTRISTRDIQPSLTHWLRYPKKPSLTARSLLDELGRPSLKALQNYGSSTARRFYYAFDVMILAGKDVMNEPLIARREQEGGKWLERVVASRLQQAIASMPHFGVCWQKAIVLWFVCWIDKR